MDLDLRFKILDLYLKLGFGTGIRDLDFGMEFGTWNTKEFQLCTFNEPIHLFLSWYCCLCWQNVVRQLLPLAFSHYRRYRLSLYFCPISWFNFLKPIRQALLNFLYDFVSQSFSKLFDYSIQLCTFINIISQRRISHRTIPIVSILLSLWRLLKIKNPINVSRNIQYIKW